MGFCPVVWLLPVDLYPSVRYEGFMLACLAAHQPQQVSPLLRLSLRTPPALPACCLSVFLFFEEIVSFWYKGRVKLRDNAGSHIHIATPFYLL